MVALRAAFARAVALLPFALRGASAGGGQRLRITNKCATEPIWIAHIAQNVVGPDPQNNRLNPGDSIKYNTPDGLSGTRYWPKMRCDGQGNKCEIGESGGPEESCNLTIGCAPPVDTKFEATFGANGRDWVDVSLVDGWTLPFKFAMSKACSPGDGGRMPTQVIDCSGLSMGHCPIAEDVGAASGAPLDLRVRHPATGAAVGCYSPCSKLTFSNWGNTAAVFGPADNPAVPYCCPTPPASPSQCRAGPVKDTQFVRNVHRSCPGVYGYSYDDGMGLLLCPDDTEYEITFFCPAPVPEIVNFDLEGQQYGPVPAEEESVAPKAVAGESAQELPPPFDCTLYDSTVEMMWPADQRLWCCKERHVGCGGLSKEDQNTAAVYVCDVGRPEQWSALHARWCCERYGRGCPAGVGAKRSWLRADQAIASASRAAAARAAEVPHDCTILFPMFERFWAEDKRAWCCKHRSRGCNGGGAGSQDAAPPSEGHSAPAPAVVAGHSEELAFDCTLPLAPVDIWSDAAKAEELLADADAINAWSANKRDWCCKHKHVACAEPEDESIMPYVAAPQERMGSLADGQQDSRWVHTAVRRFETLPTDARGGRTDGRDGGVMRGVAAGAAALAMAVAMALAACRRLRAAGRPSRYISLLVEADDGCIE